MWKPFSKKSKTEASGATEKDRKQESDAARAEHKESASRAPRAKASGEKAKRTHLADAPESHKVHRVLVSPMATEKSAHASVHNTYAFLVHKGANKVEIKKAFQAVYGVKPVSVRTILLSGKHKRYGATSGMRSDRKKALIRVPSGTTIDVYEGV